MPKKHWNKLKNDYSIEKEKEHRKSLKKSREMNKRVFYATKSIIEVFENNAGVQQE